MEDPEYTWVQHPIVKIYGTYNNYKFSRRKLKDAELLSDINSGTAAKTFDKLSNSELSDDLLLSDIPKFLSKCLKTAENKQSFKSKKNFQIGKRNILYNENVPHTSTSDCYLNMPTSSEIETSNALVIDEE
ncbi:hypothetical protein PUN28_018439 [Cardiocondyla obscurior]|uniref:Uncharacterized protein n=1 Tax=Cardiocondyla obscurior TaxID=286306 RepID=A0AAW2EDV2_9HYME